MKKFINKINFKTELAFVGLIVPWVLGIIYVLFELIMSIINFGICLFSLYCIIYFILLCICIYETIKFFSSRL